MALILKESTFLETVQKGITLVDFWAEWCGPCRMQLPILDEVSAEIGDKAVIAKVNVDEELGLAQKFGVQSIPTLILFKDGKAVEVMVGLQDKDTLINKINNLL